MSSADTVAISNEPKGKYPKSIGFIISNEFCERFNFYGMRTVLVLYLSSKLDYDDDTAVVLFHVFTSLVYFFPLLGAILADSLLGKFKTILYLSIVYATGSVVVALGAVPVLPMPASLMTIIGLCLIAVGTGGIKPCVSAFGGDQFKLPEQAKQIATFFSLFYFAINAGSLLSTSITPILRENVQCFGDKDCYSLAFGVPGILMVFSVAVFLFGKHLYIIKKPAGNMVVLVTKCIGNAIKMRSKEKEISPKKHWLDYAEAKYGKKLVEDVKKLLKILVLYLPLPIFWALYDQQGSRWTFQATRMDGDIGLFTIKPDQMQVVNSFLILLFIPLFDVAVYPLLAKIGIKRPLQKLTLGGILAAIAFIMSGLIELKLEQTYPIIPGSGEGQINIFNGMPCDYNLNTTIPGHEEFVIKSMKNFEEKYLNVPDNVLYDFSAISTNPTDCPMVDGHFYIKSEKSVGYFIKRINGGAEFQEYDNSPDKSKNGFPLVRILSNVEGVKQIQLQTVTDEFIVEDITSDDMNLKLVPAGQYNLLVDNKSSSVVDLRLGGVYTVILFEDKNEKYTLKEHINTVPNTLHMLWLIPQYVVITAAEITFSITGLEFSYSQAPNSMKSVLQACWLLTVAFGNLIVAMVAESRAFKSQAAEFFLFAALMLLDMGIFVWLTSRYEYSEPSHEDEELNESNCSLDDSTMTNKGNNGITNIAYRED